MAAPIPPMRTVTAPKRAKHADAPVNASLSSEAKIQFYRDMIRIRRFELVSLQHYQAGRMGEIPR